MLRKILLAVLAVVVLLAIVIAMRPATFHIERSTHIDAPPEVVFAQVNDFNNWDAWSPWAKMDPSMHKTISTPPAGVGAAYYWRGNDQVGEGRMTITDSRPSERVRLRLEFLKPWAAVSTATFAFSPDPSGTQVTWAMDGNNTFLSKAFTLFVDTDKMVGGSFEQGLAQMKAAAEAAHQRRTTSRVPTRGAVVG